MHRHCHCFSTINIHGAKSYRQVKAQEARHKSSHLEGLQRQRLKANSCTIHHLHNGQTPNCSLALWRRPWCHLYSGTASQGFLMAQKAEDGDGKCHVEGSEAGARSGCLRAGRSCGSLLQHNQEPSSPRAPGRASESTLKLAGHAVIPFTGLFSPLRSLPIMSKAVRSRVFSTRRTQHSRTADKGPGAAARAGLRLSAAQLPLAAPTLRFPQPRTAARGARPARRPPAPAAVLTGRARRSRRRRRGARHRAAPSASSTAGPRMAAAVRPQPMAAVYRRRRPRPPRPFPRPAPRRAQAAGLRPSLIQTQRPGLPPAAGKGLPMTSCPRGGGGRAAPLLLFLLLFLLGASQAARAAAPPTSSLAPLAGPGRRMTAARRAARAFRPTPPPKDASIALQPCAPLGHGRRAAPARRQRFGASRSRPVPAESGATLAPLMHAF